ncbi:MAG: hypothetical protein IPM97_08415 [Bdellovibrionaceae bacterium]|nr:hypothetical protein [Pseudobdellovibrionaceae bacterium]
MKSFFSVICLIFVSSYSFGSQEKLIDGNYFSKDNSLCGANLKNSNSSLLITGIDSGQYCGDRSTYKFIKVSDGHFYRVNFKTVVNNEIISKCKPTSIDRTPCYPQTIFYSNDGLLQIEIGDELFDSIKIKTLSDTSFEMVPTAQHIRNGQLVKESESLITIFNLKN